MVELVTAYQEVLKAISALNSLCDAVHIAREGCGLSIPTDTHEYTAQMHGWLLNEKTGLEVKLGLELTKLREENERLQRQLAIARRALETIASGTIDKIAASLAQRILGELSELNRQEPPKD